VDQKEMWGKDWKEFSFRDEPVKPARRHWKCPNNGCGGEMIATQEGITTNETSWKHRCHACGCTGSADRNYPAIVYFPKE
jgi:hypothetical protein